MPKFLKVSGHDGLLRDSSSKAIINTNREEYDSYMLRRNVSDKRDLLIGQQTQEISELKNELSDIKQTMALILENLNNK